MDIKYYFKPVNYSRIQGGDFLKNRYSLGYLLEKNYASLTAENVKKLKVAIVGIGDDTNSLNKGTGTAPDVIRASLYNLSVINPKMKIADFGNIKKGSGKGDLYYAVRDIVDYFKELGIKVIVIGGGQDLGLGVARAYKYEKYFQMSTIDPKIDMKAGREVYSSSNYITRILKEIPDLFHINFIGYQSYFVPEQIHEKISQNDFTAVRLGKLREDITQIEPLLRDSNFISFDISSVRLQDAPGFYDGSPNGVYSEEACQISKYAGLSNKLNVFGLFEVNPKKDKENQTSKLAAQIIWYFLEGLNYNDNFDPDTDISEIKEFNVELEELNTPLVFCQHLRTNRWWMRLEGINKNKVTVSCSENDYHIALKKEIPPQWLMFIRKIDQMSK